MAAGNSQKHGITTFRPGFAILVNLPNCSISVTVPVFTVTQGMIPHDIAGARVPGHRPELAMTIRRRPQLGADSGHALPGSVTLLIITEKPASGSETSAEVLVAHFTYLPSAQMLMRTASGDEPENQIASGHYEQ